MGVSMTVRQYLADNHIKFDTLTHPETPSMSRTAQACHVSGDCVAKAVVVKNEDSFVLAVIPASRHLRLAKLRERLRRPCGLATEAEITTLFPDCEVGAVPAVGDAYGLETLVDESLDDQSDIYFEGGDHRTLVHITSAQFRTLFDGVQHGRFSVHD